MLVERHFERAARLDAIGPRELAVRRRSGTQRLRDAGTIESRTLARLLFRLVDRGLRSAFQLHVEVDVRWRLRSGFAGRWQLDR